MDQLAPVEAAVARRYLDGELEFERAGAALEAGALMAHPEAALKYINEFRTYVVTYTYGRELAERFVDATAGPSPTAAAARAEQLADPAVMLRIVIHHLRRDRNTTETRRRREARVEVRSTRAPRSGGRGGRAVGTNRAGYRMA